MARHAGPESVKLSLRPYQQQGLDDVRVEYSRGKRAPLYVLSTGGGKTVTYAAIAEGAAARGKRVLILEHRKELIRQASLALGGIGVRHRVVAPAARITGIRRAHTEKLGFPMLDASATVVVASVQTLGRRMDWLAEFDPDLIVVDEAHHAVAGTWKRIIEACPRARLLGVTATPCRTNGQGLGDVFDCMVLGPSMKELIADGYLVRPRVVAPPVRADFSKLRKSANGDWDPDSVAEAMASREITGDAVAHYGRLCPGRPAIVFAANLKHAAEVAQAFRDAGWRFEVVHGEMEDDERDRLIYGLADGTLQGLVTKDLISEGTDIPVAEVAIMLRLTESESLFLQQAGRVLRVVYAPGFDLSTADGRLAAIEASGKLYGLVIDHVGNCGRLIDGQFVAKHGLPHDDRAWSLDGRKKRKGKAAEEIVAFRQCPECYAVHDPAPACPSCGFTYVVRVAKGPELVDGELQEVPEDAALQQRLEARRAQGRARTVDELVASVPGMNSKRAAHILAAREEKERLREQLRDVCRRWYRAEPRQVPAVTALRDAFGLTPADVERMKPKALKQSIERVTEALLALTLGAPANDNGAFVLRQSA